MANITGGGGATINNQDITVTENGVYTADTGYTGLGTVNVNVPTGTTINNQNITVTENGTYTADAGYTGLGTVEVQVPNPSTGILSIVENGSYNVAEYATAEVNVPTGATTKYGVSIDNLLGNVDENGVLQELTTEFVFDGTGIKEITGAARSAFAYRFAYTKWKEVRFPNLVSIGDGGNVQQYCLGTFAHNADFQKTHTVDMPNLETINGKFAAEEMFFTSKIDTINIPKLTTITGVAAAQNMFGYNAITQVSLPNLTTISGSSAAISMFDKNSITSVDLSSLATVSGSGACRTMFRANTGLVRVDFPSLVSVEANCFGTISANAIFAGCAGLLEIHFRADAQATIEALSAYGVKFGAPSTCTIYFDLIGTITVNGVAYSRNEPNSIRVDGTKTFVAWKDASNNIVYTNATAEPAVGTPVYSDAGTTQVGTVSEVA